MKHVIKIKFNELETEEEKDCGYDHMEIYDGPTKDFPLIGKFCGTKKPGDILSTTSQVLVVFKGMFFGAFFGVLKMCDMHILQFSGPKMFQKTKTSSSHNRRLYRR